jgi:predicted  nucleic acid-binding Zn-ribbon protein
MDSKIEELQKTIEELTKSNTELQAWKQEYSSQKQSFIRMGSRLKKICKKLTPNNETVVEMQKLSQEIKDLIKTIK